MEKSFTLEIRTPDRAVFKGSVASLVAPGALGYLGILANHASLVTTLTPGKIIFRDETGRPSTLQSRGEGFLEVHQNQVILLADEIVS